MPEQITGGCLCGKIRYTVSQPIQNIIACHCTHCQKASGSGASYNAVVPSSAVTFTSGQPKCFEDTAQSGNILKRYFCGDCGSPIYSQRAKTPEMIVLKIGTLDAPGELKLVMNIWTNSARPWMTIDPATERHPENRPVKT
ncbi:MAG: GFA family protein [Betaproteobacteria bacterium]|nr:GFA family protein [Betaproteobacteria bacterium]